MNTTTNPGCSGRRHQDRSRRLRGRVGVLCARLASWRANRRADAAQLELTVGKRRRLSADACISVIDGAALVQIDTSTLDPARRCRVYVNDGPVYDAVPDEGDHDTALLADYLAELRRQEVTNLTLEAASARARIHDLPEWPYANSGQTGLGRDWPLITLDQVVRWGGTVLTEPEIDRLVTAIPNSSIPDAIGEIVTTIADADAEQHQDQDQDQDQLIPPAFVVIHRDPRPFEINTTAFENWAAHSDTWEGWVPVRDTKTAGYDLAALFQDAREHDVITGDDRLELQVNGNDDSESAEFYVMVHNTGGRQRLVGLTSGWAELDYPTEDNLSAAQAARFHIEEICTRANWLLTDIRKQITTPPDLSPGSRCALADTALERGN